MALQRMRTSRQIHLVEVHEMTPGVSATYQVTLSTDHVRRAKMMGTAAQATSSALWWMLRGHGMPFHLETSRTRAEVALVDDGRGFPLRGSARLLEGFSEVSSRW